MKIQQKYGPGGRYQLVATLGDYDGYPPVEGLIVDHPPRVQNPEHLGMACYLAFGNWSGGELQLPVKVGPATAEAMMRDAARSGIGLHPAPIEYYPKPLPIGTQEMRLSRSLEGASLPGIYDVRIDEWSGSLRSHTSAIVPSNSFLFDSRGSSLRAHLAVGVLFANDVQADEIVLEEEVSRGERDRLASLLSAVRLGMRFR